MFKVFPLNAKLSQLRPSRTLHMQMARSSCSISLFYDKYCNLHRADSRAASIITKAYYHLQITNEGQKTKQDLECASGTVVSYTVLESTHQIGRV